MKNNLFKSIGLFFKGVGMGAANVIPGVSGGTIALITGIFEELIDSIKSFDLTAIRLLFKGKFKEFATHVNLGFLIMIFFGVAASIVSLAKLLEFLFNDYPVQVWAYFFGLILASVYFVGKTIDKWNLSVIITFVIGAAIAIGISMLSPATKNESFIYLMLCGVVAICSMILPGLSGSFVLILMGNYELVVIDAINNMRIDILLPVLLGAVVGLIAFSHLLSWVYKKFKNQTISLLTGFILGSLAILWPWKNTIYKTDALGNILTKDDGEMVIQGYQRFIPETFSTEVIVAILLALAGIASIWLVESWAMRKSTVNV
jgi:putative membrane protein